MVSTSSYGATKKSLGTRSALVFLKNVCKIKVNLMRIQCTVCFVCLYHMKKNKVCGQNSDENDVLLLKDVLFLLAQFVSFKVKSEGLYVMCFFEIFRRGPSSRFVPPVMNREENEE